MKTLAIDGVAIGSSKVAAEAVALADPPWLPKIIYCDDFTPPRNFTRPLILSGVSLAILASVGITGVVVNRINRPAISAPKQANPASAAVAPPTQTPKPAPSTPVATSVATLSTALQNTISTFAASQSAPYFVYVKDLKTGATASINSDKQILSASLYKAFIAHQVYILSDQGLIDLYGPTGYGSNLTVNECMNKMITISDNACGQALGARLGWNKLHGSFRQQGYVQTDFFSNPTRTTAADVGTLLENIYTGKYLTRESRANLMNLLLAQKVNNRLPDGLPAATPIAHKTGELNGYMHDAGIVMGPKTDYLIVAMSGPWKNESGSYSSQANLSSQIYNMLQK